MRTVTVAARGTTALTRASSVLAPASLRSVDPSTDRHRCRPATAVPGPDVPASVDPSTDRGVAQPCGAARRLLRSIHRPIGVWPSHAEPPDVCTGRSIDRSPPLSPSHRGTQRRRARLGRSIDRHRSFPAIWSRRPPAAVDPSTDRHRCRPATAVAGPTCPPRPIHRPTPLSSSHLEPPATRSGQSFDRGTATWRSLQPPHRHGRGIASTTTSPRRKGPCRSRAWPRHTTSGAWRTSTPSALNQPAGSAPAAPRLARPYGPIR